MILKGDKGMKKIFCLMLAVTVLLSVLIFPASASFLEISGSSLDVSEDPSGITARSSESLISEPYTPADKMPAGSKEN